MIESIAPRTAFGLPMYAGDRAIDPVNGGERAIPRGDDLQLACISKLPVGELGDPRLCTSDVAAGSPLCDGSGNQVYAGAYPGLRHLRILHDLGSSGLAASICEDDFAPAMDAIFAKVDAALNSQCMRSTLETDAVGYVPCLVLESFASATPEGKTRCEDIDPGYCTPGARPCRADGDALYPPFSPGDAASKLTLTITAKTEDGTLGAVKAPAFAEGGNVYVKAPSDDTTHLVCEVMQLVGHGVPEAVTNACLHDPTWKGLIGVSGESGWCYSTDANVVGDVCTKLGAPGTVRFEGGVQPRAGSEVFPICLH
jgi:hypothetical protein